MASEVGVRGTGGPGFTDRGVCLLELVFTVGQGCLSNFNLSHSVKVGVVQ